MPATIEQVMTAAPQTIGAEVTVETARRMMREFAVGHLPVRAEGLLVGVVNEADLSRAAAHHPVAAVMRRDPLVVAPQALAEDVLCSMTTRHQGAAIVVNGQRVVGIFTAGDAHRALCR